MTDKFLYNLFLAGGLLMIFLAGFGFAHESNMLVGSLLALSLGVVVAFLPLFVTLKQLAYLEEALQKATEQKVTEE